MKNKLTNLFKTPNSWLDVRHEQSDDSQTKMIKLKIFTIQDYFLKLIINISCFSQT